MTTISVRHGLPPTTHATRDAKMLTTTRLTAEPAADLPRGGLGTLYTGVNGNGELPPNISLVLVSTAAQLRAAGATESAADIEAILRKYGGGGSHTVNSVGIVATDKDDATRSTLAEIKARCDDLAQMNKTNRDFWAKRAP